MTNPFAEEILERTGQATGIEPEALRGLLSVPPSEEMGDYAIPCFTLAKQLRRNPAQGGTLNPVSALAKFGRGAGPCPPMPAYCRLIGAPSAIAL